MSCDSVLSKVSVMNSLKKLVMELKKNSCTLNLETILH